MTALVHPLTLNAALGIDILPSDNGPATDHPDAPNATKAYVPSTGDWYTKKAAGWVQDGTTAGGSADWANITSKPTTVAGYGITDAFTQSLADARYWTQAQADGRFLKLSGGTMTGDLVGTRLTFHDNLIYESYTNGPGNLAFNYLGYAGGTSQFRDTSIYDGKQNPIAVFSGASRSVGLYGDVVFNQDVTERYIRTAYYGGYLRLRGNSGANTDRGLWLGVMDNAGSGTPYVAITSGLTSIFTNLSMSGYVYSPKGTVGTYTSTYRRMIYAIGDAYKGASDGNGFMTSIAGVYALLASNDTALGITGHELGDGFEMMGNGVAKQFFGVAGMWSDGSLWINGNGSFGGALSANTASVTNGLSCGSLSISGYSPTVVRTGSATTVPGDLLPSQIYFGY